MKKQLAILAAALIATGAWANTTGHGGNGGGNGGSHGNNQTPPACDICTKGVIVKGPQIQVTAMNGSASIAKTYNNSTANNNMSSNTNGVLLEGPSVQLTALSHTGVLAKATNGSFAQNNLASNIGNVGISPNGQLQVVAARGSFLGASADLNSRSVQNFSTNNACVDCR